MRVVGSVVLSAAMIVGGIVCGGSGVDGDSEAPVSGILISMVGFSDGKPEGKSDGESLESTIPLASRDGNSVKRVSSCGCLDGKAKPYLCVEGFEVMIGGGNGAIDGSRKSAPLVGCNEGSAE